MDDGQLRKSFLLFLTLILISLFFFITEYRGWLGPLRGWLERPVVALEKPFYEINQSVRQSVSQLISLGKSDRQVFELQGRLRQLATDQNQLATCLEENERLKKLLGAPLPPSWKFIEARVVGISEKMRLDRGKNDGIKEGMVVISENILVGKVVAVQVSTSLVQLVNDPNSKIPVIVKRANSTGIQARGLLLGQYGEKLVLDRILQSEDVQKGDLVVTSGEEEWLADLLIGQIEEVAPQTAEVYKRAIISPLINYQDLSIVFLVVR